MPPKICNQSNFFWELHFGSGIKKICLSVFTGCQGLAGRKKIQPISHRNCTRDSKLDLSMHCSHEGPPMMDPSTDLLPAQKLTAGDAQKLTFRFLNVSEKFSWNNCFTKNCTVFTKAPTYFFRQKMDAKMIEIWKTSFSIWNQFFFLRRVYWLPCFAWRFCLLKWW